MKKIIKKINQKEKIIQITVCDERWYIKSDEEGNNVYVPSVTWISSFYPKGVAFFKWLASKGWNEAEAIKNAAGEKGSKIHQGITALLVGMPVPMDSKFRNPTTEQEEELTLEEYEALMSFVIWYKETAPITLENELVVFNDRQNYAGTIDWLGHIGKQLWLIDFKSSQYIWPSHLLQLAAYKHALEEGFQQDIKLAILQLGFNKNKKRFKLTEIEDKFDLFLACQQIWKSEMEGVEPPKRDYPESLTLDD